MKKNLLIVTTLILLLCLSGCYYFTDPVITSLPMYETREFYTSGGFQDSDDYAKYTYESVTAQRISKSWYFDEVTADDIEEILLHIENFEARIDGSEDEVTDNYDFDKSNVSVGDFFYLYTKDGEPIGDGTYDKFDFYDLYYFDVEGQILYYFHSDV